MMKYYILFVKSMLDFSTAEEVICKTLQPYYVAIFQSDEVFLVSNGILYMKTASFKY